MSAPRFGVLVVASVVLLGACAGRPKSSAPAQAPAAARLVGTWEGSDGTRFRFEADGRALWIFKAQTPPDTFALRYAVAATAAPPPRAEVALDLTGFDRGFLSGRSLYCLLAFGEWPAASPAGSQPGAVVRMDCEPGPPTAAGAVRRPTAFTGGVKVYRRVP